jgi:hypothetical protein
LLAELLFGGKGMGIVARKAADVGTSVFISGDVPGSETKPTLETKNLRGAFYFFISSGLFALQY